MVLPLLLSSPHAGLMVPDYLKANCLLTVDEIVKDGDEYAQAIYAPLKEKVQAFVSSDIARAVLDLNRAEDDIRKDGVVKTHTCWENKIWRQMLDQDAIQTLLNAHHRPYHQQLSTYAKQKELLFAVDCHTMAAFGPPVGPDPDASRPNVCLGNANGQSCPEEMMDIILSAFQAHFPGEVTVNRPFSGGYITQQHGKEMPWVQLELSRGDFATPEKKSEWVYAALKMAVEGLVS